VVEFGDEVERVFVVGIAEVAACYESRNTAGSGHLHGGVTDPGGRIPRLKD